MSAAPRPPGLCPSASLHEIRAAKKEATQRLLGATMGLSDEEWQAPSRLAGWTRAHIATHLARNAEAFEAVTKAVVAHLAVPPLYPSDDIRDRDIERGSERTGLQLQIDLDTTAGSLNTAFDALDDMTPGTVVSLTHDIRVDVTDLPALRLAEIALHHVDLDLGMTVDDLPDVVARTLLEWVCFRLRDRPEVPAMRIVSDSGLTDRIGGVGFATTIHGPDGALAGWLSGRGGTERIAGADQLAVPMLI
ncbi:maleylpyruvate isomerase family mycothiol-dependent enzyme [Cutibacterium sp. WCA-380-WT-3A]|uniref:Maleylpyruvate isomerase family mycothiol-dependent enzyme n=2 Tax=Cutibacterium porci TaxID=2605781 RepID=A0A7K0J769_9ACTN|nr:maleylpyruvate isomerase family mycothiol-dependent enzyme [Cutibacterium porci]